MYLSLDTMTPLKSSSVLILPLVSSTEKIKIIWTCLLWITHLIFIITNDGNIYFSETRWTSIRSSPLISRTKQLKIGVIVGIYICATSSCKNDLNNSLHSYLVINYKTVACFQVETRHTNMLHLTTVSYRISDMAKLKTCALVPRRIHDSEYWYYEQRYGYSVDILWGSFMWCKWQLILSVQPGL